MALPTAIEMVSKFLWGDFTWPDPSQLADSKWIRGNNETSQVNINAAEYMLIGAGK